MAAAAELVDKNKFSSSCLDCLTTGTSRVLLDLQILQLHLYCTMISNDTDTTLYT